MPHSPTFSGQTHIGMKRSQNQDSFGIHAELGLFVVADGMGGHKGGETASALAVEVIPRVLSLLPAELPGTSALREAISEANAAIFQRALEDPSLKGMGTTVTAAWHRQGELWLGQVGDSRAYLLRGPCTWQLSRDHSLVAEKLRAGLLTREELRTNVNRNVITRSVGFESHVSVDVAHLRPQAGDRLILCSDGLTSLVPDPTLQTELQRLSRDGAPPESWCEALIALANQHGGDDNITVITIVF